MFPVLLTVTTNPHIQLVFYFPPMSWPLFRPQPSLTLFKESLSIEVPQPLVSAFVTPPLFYREANFLKGTCDSVTLLLTTVNGLSYVQIVFKLPCTVHRMLPLKPMCSCTVTFPSLPPPATAHHSERLAISLGHQTHQPLNYLPSLVSSGKPNLD